MKKKLILATALAGICLCGCNHPQSVTITVANPLDAERTGEMIEVPAAQVFQSLNLPDTAHLIVCNGQAQEIPYQLTHDGKLIFPVSVAAQGNATYTIRQGTPIPADTVVYGRQYPERLDDIAWENDRAAYRAYGPALQKTGERAYGYDVFTKNTDRLVVEDRYALELDSASWAQINALRKAGKQKEADELVSRISYHVDHGNGMDCYAVGPTLGGGTSALMPDSVIVYPYCYKEYEILDNGPLRFTLRLTFNPLTIGNDTNVVETRIIQLDKGSQLNKTTVTYSNLTQPVPVAGGIVLHAANAEGYAHNAQEGYIAYADPTTEPQSDNGTVYVGAVFPDTAVQTKVQLFDKPAGDAIGHVLGICTYQPDAAFTYYWGSGWSKYGFDTDETWTEYLKTYARQVRHPLQVTVK